MWVSLDHLKLEHEIVLKPMAAAWSEADAVWEQVAGYPGILQKLVDGSHFRVYLSHMIDQFLSWAQRMDSQVFNFM